MKILTRPFRPWWCTSGGWWTASQRLTLWRPCRSLERSGGERQINSALLSFTRSLIQPAVTLSRILTAALLLFCSYVVVMPKKRQALVEYEDMNGSSTAVTFAADNQVYIAGHPAFINYSTSQKISRPGDSDDSRSVNNVLLLTIMNPIYPITTVSTAMWLLCLHVQRQHLLQVIDDTTPKT